MATVWERLSPRAWLNVQWDEERGFVAVVKEEHTGYHGSTLYFGRGETREEAIVAALDGLDRVIEMNEARDKKT